jgi:phosphotriesterase-related protein
MSDDTGDVVTVDGRIDPEDLGVTLPHEHFSTWTDDADFDAPDEPAKAKLAREPMSLENYWYVRRNPSEHLENTRIHPMEHAVPEVERYHRSGGDTIVDVSSKGKERVPETARKVARATGVNVVRGTSYYTQDRHPDHVANRTVAELAEEFVGDVQEGIGDSDVRAGIIGEVGTSTNHEEEGIHSEEEKVVRASARAAAETGAALTIHPPSRWPEDRDPEKPASMYGLHVVEMAEEEGLPPERVVIGHMDQSKYWLEDLSYQKELADRGAVVEYDLFGHTQFMDGYADTHPSDVDRALALTELIDAGYEEHLVMSHDIFMRHLLSRYGGFGYAHVIENIVPLLRDYGVSQDTIDQMLVETPKRLLTFDEPR